MATPAILRDWIEKAREPAKALALGAAVVFNPVGANDAQAEAAQEQAQSVAMTTEISSNLEIGNTIQDALLYGFGNPSDDPQEHVSPQGVAILILRGEEFRKTGHDETFFRNGYKELFKEFGTPHQIFFLDVDHSATSFTHYSPAGKYADMSVGEAVANVPISAQDFQDYTASLDNDDLAFNME